MEIIPGIHRIDGVRGANAYLVIGEDETLAIDTGMPGNAKRIAAYVEGLGKNLSDIKFIILTHADIDHVGSAAELKSMTGARLAIHTDDAPILRGKQSFKTIRGPLGFIFKLAMRLIRYHPAEPDIILSADSEIEGFKIIHVPGHTNGSICIYKPGKVIFVGDALKSDSSGNPKPPSRTASLDEAKARASLMAISALDFDTLLPGHGAPVVSNASQKLKNMIARPN
jgi:glyoxylase-like metal-dependent hydrolase (beta-lactamase superfamily II)